MLQRIRIKALPPLKPGDQVIRWLAGTIPRTMQVIATEPFITCIDISEDSAAITAQLNSLLKLGKDATEPTWDFDPLTGAEVDDVLGWGPPPRITGSFITPLAITKPSSSLKERHDA